MTVGAQRVSGLHIVCWKLHRLGGVAVVLFAGLVTAGCSGDIQKNRIAVPVEVGRKVLSTDSRNGVPDKANLPKSAVFSQLPTPKRAEFVPVAAFARGNVWYITAYEVAPTIEDCTIFLRDWSGKMPPGAVKRAFCVGRGPKVKADFRIKDVQPVTL